MQNINTESKYNFILSLLANSLTSTRSILMKCKAYAGEQGISDADFLAYKLADDMFGYVKQIQIVSDSVKTAAGKLAGKDIPVMADTEQTFDELLARIDKTEEYLNSFSLSDFANADNAKITFNWMPGKYITASDYAEKFLVANLYFHVTTAYDIARSKGVKLGKMDFLATDLGFKDLA